MILINILLVVRRYFEYRRFLCGILFLMLQDFLSKSSLLFFKFRYVMFCKKGENMKSIVFICVMSVILMLSACGRMSAPQKPADSIYPKNYTVQI